MASVPDKRPSSAALPQVFFPKRFFFFIFFGLYTIFSFQITVNAGLRSRVNLFVVLLLITADIGTVGPFFSDCIFKKMGFICFHMVAAK